MQHQQLARLLNSIGKATFVHHFADFSLSHQEVVGLLPEEYTLKARHTRTSKARRIFREGLHDKHCD